MSKKEIFKGKCLYLDHEGKGVVKYHNRNLSVPYLMPGEKAKIEFIKNKNKEDEINILELKNESKDATEARCEYYFECGACHLQHMKYKAQLRFKEKEVERALYKFGEINPIIQMDNPYNYRNKVHSTFAETQNGKIVSGLYKENTHSIVPIERCIIQDPKADEILQSIRKIFKKHKMHMYNEYSKKGFLRHVLIRTGFSSNEVMVVFVVAHNRFHSKNKIINELLNKHPEISTIIMNINNKDTSMVLGEKEKVLYGNGKILDTLCGLDFLISSKSFYQVNPVQTKKLYEKAMEFADISNKDIVLDAYCGIGTIGLLAAKRAKKVYGVELNESAINNAKKNAKLNSIENINFFEADASDFIKGLVEENYPVDIIFLDPPREGSDKKFLSSVVKLKPKKVIYISCNPKTQKRDVKYLTKHNYKVKEIQPVDLFPQTYHVENICLLERTD
ncbi:MAG: 23S rRNA (uracil(1939)-C(5))-methyltransferase RlmD [Bacillota bacterium]